MSRRFAAVVVTGVLCLSSAAAEAQPTVKKVHGHVADDRTITIEGAFFGTKAAAAPLVWEDFSDGALDPNLVNHGPGPAEINGDNLRHPFSPRNVRADYKRAGAYFGYDAATAPKWFVQYWIKLASNWHWGTSTYDGVDDGLANVKFFRMFPKGSRTYANAGYATHGFTGGDVHRFVENGEQTYLGINGQGLFTPGAWHCVQIEYGENRGAGEPNGTMRLWVDGVLTDSTTTLDTNPVADGEAIDKRPYIIGLYDSWGPSDAPVDNMYAYYSDVYVDNGWSRVELGNAPTYAGSTQREMLIPASWSDRSITARVAQGAFTEGDKAYIYVVDASGKVNAEGFKVKISKADKGPKNGK
jgi:hypothetical protein